MNRSSVPRVLMIGNFLSGAGGNRGVCDDLADFLRQHGQPVLTTSSKTGRISRLFDMLATVYQSRDEYQLAQLDVYSGLAFTWAEVVCGLLKFLGKPFILTLHGGNLPGFASRNSGRVKHLLRSASVVTAPSRYLQEQMYLYRNEILLIPNPLEVQNYFFRSRPRPFPRLVWLRAFHALYNPTLAVKVIAILCRFLPEIHLEMIGPEKGDGSLRETQEKIAELGLQRQITIVPGITKNQVPKWLAQSDVFINTTSVDNTPVSVLEAMACGLCIVSTNVGGIPYMLEDGEEALLVQPNDPEMMASAVRRILTERGLAERLSRNARRKAEHYDWAVIFPMWEELFSEIASLRNSG